jgi:hypothetical protein
VRWTNTPALSHVVKDLVKAQYMDAGSLSRILRALLASAGPILAPALRPAVPLPVKEFSGPAGRIGHCLGVARCRARPDRKERPMKAKPTVRMS